MDVVHINAVVRATESIFQNYFGVSSTATKPYMGNFTVKSNEISVIIGVTGELDGQIVCSFNTETAKRVVGKMMGMEINELDDMGWSAIQEFGNWVAGTTATELSTTGVIVDVTIPIINEGNSRFRSNKVFVTVPMESEIGTVEVHVSLAKDKKKE